MDPQQTPYLPIDILTWRRLVHEVKVFAASEVGWRAKAFFGLLMMLLLAISGMNVVGSYVSRDFMTAIEHRETGSFIGLAFVYILVFAVSTVIGAMLRFFEERLGLMWREWLTKRLVEMYLHRGVYYRLSLSGELANPDQRIAEDVRAFTTTTLSFALMILNSTITVVAFAGVLWSISPLLLIVSVLYAAGGSFISFYLGRTLAGLNYSQLDKEANFRAELIHVRENAESVALLHREERLSSRLQHRIDELVTNFGRIILVNRNLAFSSIGYNYLVQIIPALIVAPLFISGSAPFGIIAQSAIAFVHLAGAFSLIVTNFASLSSFTAVVARLGSLEDVMSRQCAEPFGGEAPPPIEVVECVESDRVAFEGLTLLSQQDGRVLIKDLTATAPYGSRLLISGTNEDAKVALFRATAEMWINGEGRIFRPEPKQIYFLPERPYLPPGTLRDMLTRSGEEEGVTEERIWSELQALNLESVVERVGGLDAQHDWHDLLNLSEQQLFAFARLFIAAPRFAFLERIRTALDVEDESLMLKMLTKKDITYISLGRSRHGKRDSDDKLYNYDAVLELGEDGGWNWKQVNCGEIVEDTGK